MSLFCSLSGNPPFYDETEEENTDLHNRIIFCRIVAGDFEFDSPYWDDISPAAKDLVCRLMEVDQMLRITAQDALWHEWIAGNGASEKNLKDGVCAQFEKNFAKAKWRVWIHTHSFSVAVNQVVNSRGVKGGESEQVIKIKPQSALGCIDHVWAGDAFLISSGPAHCHSTCPRRDPSTLTHFSSVA
uniref:Protein kinase domain-containing protein n=1 Tax=Mastacembelus armatus TaxID=205130 RepID=A0A7N8XBZ3_9TELE